MTGPPIFLKQPKFIGLAVLSFNYWLYDSNATRYQKIFLKVLDSCVFLVPFEFLSHYPDTGSSH